VRNAIDVRGLKRAQNAISSEDLFELRNQMNIHSENVCLFIGGMYPEKRLDFLLGACKLVRERIEDFEMIFIGAGPDDFKVRSAADAQDWIHYLGPIFYEQKIPYFMLSKLVLMPGLVGLSVLDAFTFETPIVTTSVPFHSPEIEYLNDGVNGLIVKNTDDPDAFASTVVELLGDSERLLQLRLGCQVAREEYSIETMANRFADGIRQALT
jgi:glycosyltransferase involved in cell wall biosynthesis